MKKICIVLILLSFLLSACARAAHSLRVDDAAKAVLQEFGETEQFQKADEDFITTNFDTENVTEAAVYFADDGTEFGFFQLADINEKDTMQASIRAYVNSERESVNSLAALYPAEELTRRLERFDHVNIGVVGDLVYYFISDEALTKRALKQIHS
ncbi:MAG: hypothetical protein IJY50_09890 [Clostridia bacterium]|nr:hypothetical protein [Clostridia bacterium]